MSFCHLHCHTQFSLLDGATDIGSMMEKAKADGMPAVALTDHGNMFGCFDFVNEAKKNHIKPILGCEFYLVKDRFKQSFSKISGERDERFHQLILAKNQEGYENLSKLCSLGFIEGMYGKYPRIDKELLKKFHKGLIATSCCIGAEIPQAIIHGRLEEAEELLKWWLDLLGEDFYIEIQRQAGNENLDQLGISQEQVNQQLLALAKKHNVQVIATNDVHYLDQEDAVPHDILLCINTASNVADENRFKFSSSEYFFKTSEEMKLKFADIPQAIENTVAIADKVFNPSLIREIILPNFPLPIGFEHQDDYLKHLVYEGAVARYGEITEKIRERLDYELLVIKNMKFAGYFLVVQDFIKAARELRVSVGPGRGSAAGSAVAYCLTITDIDPLKYNLLFERFLNPERVSMPDIDIDFDDRNRDKVMDYVVNKYGKNQVAQIVTFGTMAAKSSIRDVARVKGLELSIADRLAKLVPNKPGTKLNEILDLDKVISDDFQAEDKNNILELRNILKGGIGLESDVLKTAKKLEGSVRNTGVHAAGVIIAPDEIMKFIPVSTAKDTNLWVTQVEGNVIEQTGLLKMDFLGLTTLSIIEDTLDNIAKRKDQTKRIDIHEIPLDDLKTLQLFQQGQTIGLFQFESDPMRGHLKNLKPTSIEDIIAMNALYRPGPMDNIKEFIDRKHGRVPVIYPHEWMQEILSPTYGIMVYQEQIMQSAQIMADYSLGEADILRRAMGKKKKEEMEKQSAIFVERAMKKGISQEKAQEIFDVMAKFAMYGFNRSHAAAYSVLAFQTGYLKTHYPAEFMAAVLTANKDNLDSLRTYLNEAKSMKLKVLGPDINESQIHFTVNDHGQIRFGLSALKGVGEGPVEEIIVERERNGPFLSFADMIKRLNSKIFNKKVIESCVFGGAFDCFTDMHRAQYFAQYEKSDSYIEYMLRWGQSYHAGLNNMQQSLFGESVMNDIKIPQAPEAEEWNTIQKLNYEVDIAGIFLSAHPLDDYSYEMQYCSNCSLDQLEGLKEEKYQGILVKICGRLLDVQHRMNKKGEGFGSFVIQDYQGSLKVFLFRENYLRYKNLLNDGTCVAIEGFYKKNTWKADSDEWELDIKGMRLLSTALEQTVKHLSIGIPVHSISEDFIVQMERLFKDHKGTLVPKIELVEIGTGLKLEFLSTQNKLKISGDLLGRLEALHLPFKINEQSSRT